MGHAFRVISDGGSQFKCKGFETFANEWGFIHTLSSPTHAQSNDKTEAAVKNIKKLLKKCGSLNDKSWKGLLAIRNTPLLFCKSPPQRMLGRKLHDSLPRFQNTNSQFLDKSTKEKIHDAKQKEKSYYNKHITKLTRLKIGSRVKIRSRVDTNWCLRGAIAVIGENRNYSVLTDQWSTLIRKRIYLCPAPSWQECPAPPEATSELENSEPPPLVNTRSWRWGHGASRDSYPQIKRKTRK